MLSSMLCGLRCRSFHSCQPIHRVSTWEEQGIKPSGLPTCVCQDDSPHLAILIPAEHILISASPADSYQPIGRAGGRSVQLLRRKICVGTVHCTFLRLQLRASEVHPQQTMAASTAHSGGRPEGSRPLKRQASRYVRLGNSVQKASAEGISQHATPSGCCRARGCSPAPDLRLHRLGCAMAVVGQQEVHEGAVGDHRQAPLRPGHQPPHESASALPDLVVALPAVPLPVHIVLFLNLHIILYSTLSSSPSFNRPMASHWLHA